MKWLILLFLFPVVAAAADDGVEKAVLRVCDQMTEAAQSLDADRMFSYVRDTDRGAIIQSGSVLMTREQALEQVKAGFAGLRKVEYRWNKRTVTVLSPAVALLVADGVAVVTTDQGATFSAPYAQSVVYTLKAGEWKVQHAHHSTPPRR